MEYSTKFSTTNNSKMSTKAPNKRRPESSGCCKAWQKLLHATENVNLRQRKSEVHLQAHVCI